MWAAIAKMAGGLAGRSAAVGAAEAGAAESSFASKAGTAGNMLSSAQHGSSGGGSSYTSSMPSSFENSEMGVGPGSANRLG